MMFRCELAKEPNEPDKMTRITIYCLRHEEIVFFDHPALQFQYVSVAIECPKCGVINAEQRDWHVIDPSGILIQRLTSTRHAAKAATPSFDVNKIRRDKLAGYRWLPPHSSSRTNEFQPCPICGARVHYFYRLEKDYPNNPDIHVCNQCRDFTEERHQAEVSA